MVRYGYGRLFPGAEWGAKDTRNLIPVAKVDARVTELCYSFITCTGYAGIYFRPELSAKSAKPPIPMVRYGNERPFPNAEWGAMNIRNLFPCLQG
jgi:hypothetical protein